jgi:uncharacterized protein (DUF1778 family)
VAIDLASHATDAEDESREDRFNGRISVRNKALITRAATAVGLTFSDYMVQAAREKALDDLQIVTLSKLGSERLYAVLADEDDQPNEALVAAARRHRSVWIALTTAERFSFKPFDRAYDRTAFSCGNADLDRYFREQLGQDVRADVAAGFLCIDEGHGAIAGFYTLSATAIRYELLPADDRKRVTRYALMPAILLGRLASSESYQKTPDRIGEKLLVDALARAARLRAIVGALGVVVDAIDDRAQTFYEKYGFRLLNDPPQRSSLFLKMSKVAALEKLFSPTTR